MGKPDGILAFRASISQLFNKLFNVCFIDGTKQTEDTFDRLSDEPITVFVEPIMK